MPSELSELLVEFPELLFPLMIFSQNLLKLVFKCGDSQGRRRWRLLSPEWLIWSQGECQGAYSVLSSRRPVGRWRNLGGSGVPIGGSFGRTILSDSDSMDSASLWFKG